MTTRKGRIFITIGLAAMLFCPDFCYADSASSPTRLLFVLSNKFITASGGAEKAMAQTSAEFEILKKTFQEQNIPATLDLVGFEQMELSEGGSSPTREGCEALKLVFYEKNTWPTFQSVSSLRKKHQADIVVFWVYSPVTDKTNAGSTCVGLEPEDNQFLGSYIPDDSYLFVDRAGLGQLTFAHELGHLYGLKRHQFLLLPSLRAGTLMMANGTKTTIQGHEVILKRIPAFSDDLLSYQGLSLNNGNGINDTTVIRRNADSVSHFFELWSTGQPVRLPEYTKEVSPRAANSSP